MLGVFKEFVISLQRHDLDGGGIDWVTGLKCVDAVQYSPIG